MFPEELILKVPQVYHLLIQSFAHCFNPPGLSVGLRARPQRGRLTGASSWGSSQLSKEDPLVRQAPGQTWHVVGWAVERKGSLLRHSRSGFALHQMRDAYLFPGQVEVRPCPHPSLSPLCPTHHRGTSMTSALTPPHRPVPQAWPTRTRAPQEPRSDIGSTPAHQEHGLAASGEKQKINWH